VRYYYATTTTTTTILLQLLLRDAGLQQKIFLKYAELYEAKYVVKYAEFGEICGAMLHMAHICGIFFAYFQHMQFRVMENHNHNH